jgi:hypothetical protein
MASPQGELEKLVRFVALDASPDRLAAAAALADGSRTRRFDDERYLPWRSRVAELPSARELGYE